MEKQGVELVKHYRDLAFMGFIEVIANLRTILNNIEHCKKDITAWKPDALILVDYPGFNLRLAEFGKAAGYKIIYYISPQVWAWKQSRVYKIKKVVDLMLVILPFEKDFYKKFGVDVTFVGHPLLDAIEEDKKRDRAGEDSWKKNNGLDERPVIALVPGSRRQEVSVMLPLMATVLGHFKDYQLVVAAAPSLPDAFYQSMIRDREIKIISGQFYQVLKHSVAALVTSGTATLETALFEVPEVVCYKGSSISYHIARKLIRVKFISLVNLVMDRMVVRELIQQELTTASLVKELNALLQDENYRNRIHQDYQELKKALGSAGASRAAAEAIQGLMTKSQ